jgi:hypothetical protein
MLDKFVRLCLGSLREEVMGLQAIVGALRMSVSVVTIRASPGSFPSPLRT